MMKTSNEFNSNYVERSKLCHNMYSIGRSSEVEQMRFSDIVWDTLHKIPNIGWREPKTQTIQGMAHMNYYNPKKYYICNEHAMACALVADDKILSRDKDDNDKDCVFYINKKE